MYIPKPNINHIPLSSYLHFTIIPRSFRARYKHCYPVFINVYWLGSMIESLEDLMDEKACNSINRIHFRYAKKVKRSILRNPDLLKMLPKLPKATSFMTLYKNQNFTYRNPDIIINTLLASGNVCNISYITTARNNCSIFTPTHIYDDLSLKLASSKSMSDPLS